MIRLSDQVIHPLVEHEMRRYFQFDKDERENIESCEGAFERQMEQRSRLRRHLPYRHAYAGGLGFPDSGLRCGPVFVGAQGPSFRPFSGMDLSGMPADRQIKIVEAAFAACGHVEGHPVEMVMQLEFGAREHPYGPRLSNLLVLLPAAVERAQRQARTRRAPGLWLPRLGARVAAGNATKADVAIAAELARAAEHLKLAAGARYAQVRGFARLDRVRAA